MEQNNTTIAVHWLRYISVADCMELNNTTIAVHRVRYTIIADPDPDKMDQDPNPIL